MDPTKATSHGKAAYLDRLRVVDPETGQDVATGERGEVVCNGAVLFAGYWSNPEATKAAMRDGWFLTGDVGYFDEDGFLYLVDRLKDMIISGGENVYPAEVAVVGAADDKWGEVPVAFIVSKADARLSEQATIDECRKHLAGFKCPKSVVFLDALRRNGIGKIQKPRLRR